MQPTRSTPRGKIAKLLALLLCGSSLAQAQLSVGPSGLAPQTFDSVPTTATWATRSVPGTGDPVTTGGQVDAAVQTNTLALIADTLTTSGTVPPNAGLRAQWNSSGLYLQTRPISGNSMTLLMAKLRNDTGTNLSSITVNYTLGALAAAGSTIVEEIPGHRVYFSLTGTAGSWIRVSGLDSAAPDTAGARSAALSLGSWSTGASLYVLWADDNGSAGTTAPNVEGGYTIDNFAVNGATPAAATPVIVLNPQSQTVSASASVALTVQAGGAAPLTYQWFKNSNSIANATSATYSISSATLADSGFYHVVVSNSFGVAISTVAELVVSCASPVAIIGQPASTSLASGDTLTLNAVASGTPVISYQWYRNGSLIPNATNTSYTKVNVRATDSGLYYLVAQNCGGAAVSEQAVVSIADATFTLFGLTNYNWKYLQTGVDPGSTWMATNFNDTTWPSGRGLFGLETGTVAPIATPLTLNDGGAQKSAYYFRTTFNLTNDVAAVTLVSSNYVDDGMVIFVNGQEAIRYNMSPGAINYASLAVAANPAGERVPIVSNIPPALLVRGSNYIAVEVHQNSLTSSDILFGMHMLVKFPAPTLLEITNQPQSVVVEETKSATLTLGLKGEPAYFQWYKDGVAVANATRNPLNIFPVGTNDAGNYFVVATNVINSVTSSIVSISVLADTNPPVIVDADGTSGLTNVLVSFSELVNLTNATNVLNYRITNTVGGATLTITRAQLLNGTNVLLTTSARTANANWILVVNNVRDISPRANLIVTNSSYPVKSLVTATPMNGSWAFYDPFPPIDVEDLGTAWKEFTYDTTGWGSGLAVLYDGPNQDDVPASIGTALSQTPTYTSYFRNNFNLTVSPGGLELQLTHIVDDGAVFYLNGTEVFRFNVPATGPILYNTPATAGIANISRLGPITIPAGSLRPGANVLAAELHQGNNLSTDKAFGAQLDAIVRSLVVGPVVITGGPQDVTVFEGSPASFTVVQAGGATFRWQSNNVTLAGATNPIYTIPAVTLAMNGSTYRVGVSNTTSGLLSTNATLRVLADTNAPFVISAYSTPNTTIDVSFSEPVTAATAQNLANYRVTNAAGQNITITGASLQNGTNVSLSFAALPANQYFVVLNGIRDTSVAGNLIRSNTVVSVGFNAVVVDYASNWRYDQSATDLSANGWEGVAYDDNGWSGTGPGLLDGKNGGRVAASLPLPVGTVLSAPTAGPNGAYLNTIYFRTHFSALAGGAGTITMTTVLDDSAVIYLNGVEIQRIRMPEGAVNFNTQGAGGAVGDATYEGPLVISVTNIVAGDNVLAVEVHQIGTGSSDVTWGAQVTATVASTVLPPPAPQPVRIVSQPATNTVVGVGANLNFTVTATGDGPISYQWRKAGTNIAGATTATLALNNVQLTNAGVYTVLVSNLFSSVVSSNLNLVVTNVGPVCTSVAWSNPALVFTRLNRTNMTISWSNPVTNSCGSNAVFTLQQALFLTNPVSGIRWSNVTTVSPYTAVGTNNQRFFRLQKL